MCQSPIQQEFLDAQRAHYRQREAARRHRRAADADLPGRVFEIIVLMVGFTVFSAWLASKLGGPVEVASVCGTMIGLAALWKTRRDDHPR